MIRRLNINSTCGIFESIKLNGLYLITFNNCTININELQFRNKLLTTVNQEFISTKNLMIEKGHVEKALHLEEMHE